MISPAEAFLLILDAMDADNGGEFFNTVAQRTRGEAAVAILQDQGFFDDDPNDLDGSFWMAAAGESTEAMLYFDINEVAYAAYRDLDEVLNEIFNNG